MPKYYGTIVIYTKRDRVTGEVQIFIYDKIYSYKTNLYK